MHQPLTIFESEGIALGPIQFLADRFPFADIKGNAFFH